MNILQLKRHALVEQKEIAFFFLPDLFNKNIEFLSIFMKTIEEIELRYEKDKNLNFLDKDLDIEYEHNGLKAEAKVVKKLTNKSGTFAKLLSKIEIYEFRVRSKNQHYRVLFIFDIKVSLELLFTLGFVKVNHVKDVKTDVYKVYSADIGKKFCENQLIRGVDYDG